MELAATFLSLACLTLAVIIAVLAVGIVLAIGFLFREAGQLRSEMLRERDKLRSDLDRLDEVLAETLDAAGVSKGVQANNGRGVDPMGVTR